MTSSNDDTTGSPASRWPLATAQVAELFGVNAKTVTRWAKTGKLASIRTPGGHRRFRETDVKAFTDATEACPHCGQINWAVTIDGRDQCASCGRVS